MEEIYEVDGGADSGVRMEDKSRTRWGVEGVFVDTVFDMFCTVALANLNTA